MGNGRLVFYTLSSDATDVCFWAVIIIVYASIVRGFRDGSTFPYRGVCAERYHDGKRCKRHVLAEHRTHLHRKRHPQRQSLLLQRRIQSKRLEMRERRSATSAAYACCRRDLPRHRLCGRLQHRLVLHAARDGHPYRHRHVYTLQSGHSGKKSGVETDTAPCRAPRSHNYESMGSSQPADNCRRQLYNRTSTSADSAAPASAATSPCTDSYDYTC